VVIANALNMSMGEPKTTWTAADDAGITLTPASICYDFYCPKCRAVIHPLLSGIMLCHRHQLSEKIPDGKHPVRYLGCRGVRYDATFKGGKLVKVLKYRHENHHRRIVR